MISQSKALTPSMAECREELRAVLASRVFQQSQRLARLLQYVCSKAVLGEAEQVTEYTIAVDVFGKPQGFRESKDSIVRVEVHRLRKRLAAFYAQEGAGHKLRIVIPPGSYSPDFQACPESSETAAPLSAPISEASESTVFAPVVLPPRAEQDREPASATAFPLRLLLLFAAIAVIAGMVWMIRSRAQVGIAASGAMLSLPAANSEVHILAGYSGRAWTDAVGRQWQADRYFSGGESRPGPPALGDVPPDRRVFQTIREGTSAADLPEDRQMFSYDIPMKPGTYEMRLYFADPLKDSPLLTYGEGGENVRRFTIYANGRPLLEQFDSVADEGYAEVDVRAFKDIAPAADGKVHLQFIPGPHRPFVNAIELIPSREGHANPVRLSARLTSLKDAEGKTWWADNYFIRGRLIRHSLPQGAPELGELFRDERYGNFSYSIPVPAGSYTLTLFFAETIFSPLAPSTLCRGPGCRVFDVTANGVNLLHDFDIFQTGGGAFRPVVRSFRGLRPNGQGKLLLAFSPSINYAEVRAIEVVDEAP